jgi:prepilin peptidase CpaA
VLLIAACVSDLRTRRIPNGLVALIGVCGVVMAFVVPSNVTPLHAVLGLLLGLGMWLPFYAFGMMGAGDVKLFAAASTFIGPMAALSAALYTALFGGVMALLFMVAHAGPVAALIRLGQASNNPHLLRNEPTARSRRMPYALAIAAGVLTVVWWPHSIVT